MHCMYPRIHIQLTDNLCAPRLDLAGRDEDRSGGDIRAHPVHPQVQVPCTSTTSCYYEPSL
jgi:hypothetical protein